MVESKINVTVRMKPMSSREALSERNRDLWQRVSDSTLLNARTKELFGFDHVFGPDATTHDIFTAQVRPIVLEALNGVN